MGSAESWVDQIAIDAGIQGGTPVVRGTGVPIVVILEAVAAGDSIADVADAYRLSQEQVHVALGYAAYVIRSERSIALPR